MKLAVKHILFISPLDRRTVANTREQNMAEQCRALGHRTLSLTLAQNTLRLISAVLLDACTWRVTWSDAQRVLCIDPLLNPCTGLQTNLTAASRVASTLDQAHPSLKRRLLASGVRRLSPLGVLRDLTIIPTFLVHALWHTAQQGKFDVCIAYGPWAACVGWLLRKLGRVDVLIYDDQDFEPAIMRNPTRQRWAAFLERTMMQRADAIASVGERLAALRRSQTGHNVTVIPNGVRNFETTHAPKDEARPFTLIYVGNVVDWSGLDAMISALPEVLATGLRLRVLILGDGLPSYVAGLHQQVLDASLQNTVQFVGRVPNEHIGEWLAQADLGLAHFRPEPYRRYAFPLKVVEYIAAGLAIIGTQDTETEDILQRHDCGISVPFDSHEIAQAVLRFAGEPELLARCRQAALRAAPQYLWSVLTARELALADKALVQQHLHKHDKRVVSR